MRTKADRESLGVEKKKTQHAPSEKSVKRTVTHTATWFGFREDEGEKKRGRDVASLSTAPRLCQPLAWCLQLHSE